jgi:4-amino-4-deoxy-L-arabinose transferase-like glycosyltransferase
MKAWSIGLTVALAAGIGLRLYGLGQSLRVDEVEAWAHAQKSIPQILSDKDRLPHVSLLSRAAGRVIGDSETALRLPYVLYGVFSLPLIFLLGRRLFGADEGAVACLLLALSVLHVNYSQDARYYALLMFYSLCSFYLVVLALDATAAGDCRRGGAFWAGFILAQILALYLHRFALYPLALCLLLILAAAADSARRYGGRARVVGWSLIVALACAMILASQWTGLREFLSLQNPPFRMLSLRQSYLTWHYRPQGASIVWDLLQAYSGGPALGLMFLAAALAGTAANARRHGRACAALWLWVAVPVASLFIVRSVAHFELRYLIFSLPAWLLLCACGLVAAMRRIAAQGEVRRNRLRRCAPALLLGGVLLLQVQTLLAYHRLPKSRLREAFSFIAQESSAGDAVVFYPAWDILWYGYYALPEDRRLYHPAALLTGAGGALSDDFTGRHGRLWLAATWIDDPVRKKEFSGFLDALARRYELSREEVWRSRDRNDDQYVWMLQRRPTGPKAAAAGETLAAGEAGIFRDFMKQRRLWLVCNLDEVAEGMAAAGSRYFQALDDIAFLRHPSRASATQVSRFCGLGCSAVVWSGRGSIQTADGMQDFQPGDALYLPRGEGLADASRPFREAFLMLLAPPGEGGRPRGLADDGRGPRLLARPTGTLELGLRRDRAVPLQERSLRAGERLREAGDSRCSRRRAASLVWEGQIRIRSGARPQFADFRKGDLYVYCSPWTEEWEVFNQGPGPVRETHWTEDRVCPQVDLTISSATGKSGALRMSMVFP